MLELDEFDVKNHENQKSIPTYDVTVSMWNKKYMMLKDKRFWCSDNNSRSDGAGTTYKGNTPSQ